MNAILVTGGAGYIGSHTCKALARAGYLPVAYDNLVYGHPWAVQWGPLEQGDLLDSTRLAEVIARYRPVAAIHFAAYAYVGESVTDPAKYYGNNLSGTLSLLAALRAGGVERLVFSSTCATYGVPERLLIDERHPWWTALGLSTLRCRVAGIMTKAPRRFSMTMTTLVQQKRRDTSRSLRTSRC